MDGGGGFLKVNGFAWFELDRTLTGIGEGVPPVAAMGGGGGLVEADGFAWFELIGIGEGGKRLEDAPAAASDGGGGLVEVDGFACFELDMVD